MLILKKFLRDVPAVLGFGIIVALCFIALLSPLIIPDLERIYDGDLIGTAEAAVLGVLVRHRQPRARRVLARHRRFARRAAWSRSRWSRSRSASACRRDSMPATPTAGAASW